MRNLISRVIPAIEINMDGIMVKQALPSPDFNDTDPFLLLHHALITFTNNAPAIKQGLGPHPHRGFTPVTFVVQGEVHHRDSWGNSQMAKQGEVQWMHAGAGIIHSERPSQALVEKEGTQEVIQLWINSPAERKMNPPTYQYLPESAMKSFFSVDKKIVSKVIAGNVETQQSSIHTESDLLILWNEGSIGGNQTITVPGEFHAMIYIISGSLRIAGHEKIPKENLIVFRKDMTTVDISLAEPSSYLLLAGHPIGEEITQSGPFVMNSQTEILQAMRDYQMGKMGVLIEE